MISQSFKSALSTRFSVRCSSLGQRSDRKAIRLGAIPLPSLDLTGRKRPDFDSYQWQPALELGLMPTVEIPRRSTLGQPPSCILYPFVTWRANTPSLRNG